MSQTLSQKYRPKNWSELVGQNHIKITLENELKTSKLAHAYLLCGPRGIGKTTVARLVAKSLNCKNIQDGYEPCNSCSACKDINGSRALDVVEIDAATHTQVDNVRENIINNARVAPSSMKYKVFIIDEVHMLSISSFNALLKTLEEPPANTIFILATTEVHKVPATIISRCQRFDFRRPTVEDITTRLEKVVRQEEIKVDLSILTIIAKHSEGHIRDAESLLGQVLSLAENGTVKPELVDLVVPRSDTALMVNLFISIVEKNVAQSLEIINKLVEDGIDLMEFTKQFIEFLRKLMLYKISVQKDFLDYFDFDKDSRKKVVSAVGAISLQKIRKAIEIFLAKFQEIRYAALPQLPLELAVVELAEEQEKLLPSHDNTPSAGSGSARVLDALPAKPKGKAIFGGSGAVKSVDMQEAPVKRSGCKASVEGLKSKWCEFLENLKKENHSLALTLKIAQLVKLEEGILTLGFKYKFYKDRLAEKNNRGLVEKVLSQTLADDVCIECLVGENFLPEEIIVKKEEISESAQANQPDVLDMAVKAFGGGAV